jgi:hypothetical protein
MNSISTQIIEKLLNRILEQEIINQTLCEVIVDYGIISKEDLQERVKVNVNFMREKVDVMIKNVETAEKIPFIPYFGKPGEA